MTSREFDARSSTTRPVSSRENRGRHSTARAAWLLGRFIRREPVHHELYTARFGAPLGLFRSDVATVRAARIYRGTQLLGNEQP